MNNRKNEIFILSTSLFVLLLLSKVFVIGTLWLFRFFGMPQLWDWYAHLDHPGHIRFFVVLIFWCVGSIFWIIKRKNRHSKKKDGNNESRLKDDTV